MSMHVEPQRQPQPAPSRTGEASDPVPGARRFVGGYPDAALLLLRIWFGLALFAIHGWPKLSGFSGLAPNFADPIGLGPTVTLVIAILCEVVAALFLVVGWWTRWAAFAVFAMMMVAWVTVHGGAFSGPQGGELAFIYAGAAAALVLAGAGRYSLDARFASRRRSPVVS